MKRAILAFLCAAIVATAKAFAGTTGVISGVVTDDNGAPVSDVHVIVTAPSDREETSTDARGRFSLLRLPPDTFVISMEKTGYAPASYAGVIVFADNTLNLKFKLYKEVMLITGRLCRYQDVKRVVVDGHLNDLPSENTTLDLYKIYPGPFTEGLQSTPFLLQLIPGITMGGGGPIPH